MKKILIKLLSVLMVVTCITFNVLNVEAKETSYTVDFTYNGEVVNVTGDSKNYDLSSVFNSLGINEDILNIKVYDEDKTTLYINNIVKNNSDEVIFDITNDSNNWLLYSYKSFTENFIMEVYTSASTYEVLISDVMEMHKITNADTYNGSYTVKYTGALGEIESADKEISVSAETVVTINPNPASGYELGSISVKDSSGNNITVSNDYKFTMPYSDVTITVTFVNITYDDTTKTITYSGSGELNQSVVNKGTSNYPDATKVVVDGYTSIGAEAFNGKSNLTSITLPNTLTTIEMDAFISCSGLTSITIPASVKTIGDFALHDCTNLESVYFEDNSQLTSIGEDAFDSCKKLKTITIPKNVVTIKKAAFRDCENLETVIIPSGSKLTTIENSAFKDCTSLKNISIPSDNAITSIGKSAFTNCTALTSFTIPSRVTTVSEELFSDCTSLKNVTISSNATSIESFAFYGCTNLASITIPSSVTSIEGGAFFNCSGLTSVEFKGTVNNGTGISDSITISGNTYDYPVFYGVGTSGTDKTTLTIPTGLTGPVNNSTKWHGGYFKAEASNSTPSGNDNSGSGNTDKRVVVNTSVK